MAEIRLSHLFKDYQKGVHAVADFDMTIHDGEFVVLVGPSGCGKSTTLRMIAGLEDITSGEIYIDGRLVNDVHPKDRNIAMVFQNYALYPHMTVFDNLAFGLRMRKISDAEIAERVKKTGEILGLTDLLKRYPKELSGGQRQRVALGRAISRETSVFLMDEPLSNLDAKLRLQTRAEITRLHHTLKATTIYVTHDQTEAMTMSTRIVVMNDGYIQQIGTPREIYVKPANFFVAKFIGSPSMNSLNCHLTENGLVFGEKSLPLPAQIHSNLSNLGYLNKDLIMGIRPENIYLNQDGEAEPGMMQKVESQVDIAEFNGSETLIHFNLNDSPMISRVHTLEDFQIGDPITFYFDLSHVHFFDAETELRIEV